MMQTIRFDDRDWFEMNHVRDDNGRIVSREEFELRRDFLEALRNHNGTQRGNVAQGVMQTLLFGGLIWAAALFIG